MSMAKREVFDCDSCKKPADINLSVHIKSEITGSDSDYEYDPYARASWDHEYRRIDLCKKCAETMLGHYLHIHLTGKQLDSPNEILNNLGTIEILKR